MGALLNTHNTKSIIMQASPADRHAFASQLAKVRALDTKGKYKKQIDELEAKYQFVLLQSLDRFHKEMLRAQLPDKLHLIKEKLCGTNKHFAYVTNIPFSSWNLDIQRCRHCLTNTLKRMEFSHELCCEKCGLLEPLDGVSFEDNEIHQYRDYKVAKQSRPKNRCYNFKYYLDKHLRLLARQKYTVSDETVQSAKEAFDAVEAAMPKRISMPFVAFKILEKIVKPEERFLLGYFSMQVPEGSVRKHTKRSGTAFFGSSMLSKINPSCPRTRALDCAKHLASPAGYRTLDACERKTQERC